MSYDRRSTAVHEAGHAVIGRVLGLSCGSASIIQNEAENEDGYAIIADPHRTAWDWERAVFEGANGGRPPIKCRDELRAAFRGTMLARMAGAEAEIEILGHCQGGDGNDRLLIEMMAESANSEFSQELWDRYEPRMRRQTRRLVRKHLRRLIGWPPPCWSGRRCRPTK